MTSRMQESSVYNSRMVVDPLSVIYNQTQWRISKASAFYNLQYSAVKLKQYASKIRQNLVSNVAGNADNKYTVTIDADSYLKYSEDDADALVITVLVNQSESTRPKVACETILLSWGLSTVVPDATHLPYMLQRGEQKITSSLKSSLSTIFDCKFTQFSFKQYHLLQMGFLFLESETASPEKPMSFTFTSCHEVDDKLTINFEIGDVYAIWNSVKEEVTNKMEQVNLTYQMLQKQIFDMFEMDFTALDLCEVSLPHAVVKTNGTVKMKTPEMVNCAFTVLNEIGKFDTA